MGTINYMTIGEETKRRLNAYQFMKKSQKTLIRREGVIKLIKSKESGHLFSTQDLIRAAGYTFSGYKDKGYTRGFQFLSGMIKSGIIRRLPEPGTTKNAYEVIGEAKLSRKSRKIVTKKISEIVAPDAIKGSVNKKEIKDGSDKKADISSCNDSNRQYSITFTIDKKNGQEFGKKSIAKLELHETSLDTAREMIIKTIEASK